MITTSATRNETSIPSPIIGSPIGPRSWRFLNSSSTVAPAIVGSARKKLNSAAVRRSTLRHSAPRIVAPDRLTPGIIARHWMKPIASAVFHGIAETEAMSPGLTTPSMIRIAIPPTISATDTIVADPSIASICLWIASPITAAGKKAMRMLRTNAKAPGSRLMSPMTTATKVRQ